MLSLLYCKMRFPFFDMQSRFQIEQMACMPPKSKRWTLTMTLQSKFLVPIYYSIFTEVYLLHKNCFKLNFEQKDDNLRSILEVSYTLLCSKTFQLQFPPRRRNGASIKPTSIYKKFYGDIKNISHIC